MPTLPPNKRRSYLPSKEVKKGTGDQGFYNSYRWRKISKAYRRNYPICEVCYEGKEEIVESEVTDHIVPISAGGAEWDANNYMPMCHQCHNRKRGLESNGYVVLSELNFENKLIPANRYEIIEKLCQRKSK